MNKGNFPVVESQLINVKETIRYMTWSKVDVERSYHPNRREGRDRNR